MYRTRVRMQPFAGNYSHDKRFSKSNFLCRCGVSREKESHITSGKCPVYEDLRIKYDNLDSDENLVKFFLEVLERRDDFDFEFNEW